MDIRSQCAHRFVLTLPSEGRSSTAVTYNYKMRSNASLLQKHRACSFQYRRLQKLVSRLTIENTTGAVDPHLDEYFR